MSLFCRLFGHKYDEHDVCTRCGSSRGTDQFLFKKTADKTGYVLVGTREVAGETIVIPARYKKKPVVEIGREAFAKREIPFRVQLHDDIRHIGDRAFGASALLSVDFGSAHSTLGVGVFSDCRSLAVASFPEGLLELPRSAFEGCTSLTRVHLPASVKAIGERAFNGCTALAELTYEANTLSLGRAALRECRSLKAIDLPADMTELPPHLLASCSSLRSITLPGGLTSIGEYALAGCSSLVDLTLPDSLRSVASGAFCDCESIETLEFPASLTEFLPNENGDGDLLRGCTALRSLTISPAFRHFPAGMIADCTALADIHLLGGKSPDWRAIQKDEGWDNGSGYYVVHLINGRIRKGN